MVRPVVFFTRKWIMFEPNFIEVQTRISHVEPIKTTVFLFGAGKGRSDIARSDARSWEPSGSQPPPRETPVSPTPFPIRLPLPAQTFFAQRKRYDTPRLHRLSGGFFVLAQLSRTEAVCQYREGRKVAQERKILRKASLHSLVPS